MLFIFDMGGVVTGNFVVVPKMAEKLGITADKFFAICTPPLSSEEIHFLEVTSPLSRKNAYGINKENLDDCTSESERPIDLYSKGLIGFLCRGDITPEQFWIVFELRSGLRVSTDYWQLYFCPTVKQDTLDLLTYIRSQKSDNRIVCGTNTMSSHYDIHLARGDYSVFDKVYASQQMGVIKPDVQFWKMILEGENTSSDNTVFFDDNKENVNAASKLGIHAFLFTDVVTARKQLISSGYLNE